MHLLLLRHGHAEAASTHGDAARQLSRHGQKDIRKVARQAAADGFLPDLALCSSAVRTRETAELFLANLPTPVELVVLPQLYLCGWKTIWDEAAALLDTFDRVLVVGHNPGISDLASRLSPPGHHHDGLHTAELAIFAAPRHAPTSATNFAPLAHLRP